jgi:hypothetical protein
MRKHAMIYELETERLRGNAQVLKSSPSFVSSASSQPDTFSINIRRPSRMKYHIAESGEAPCEVNPQNIGDGFCKGIAVGTPTEMGWGGSAADDGASTLEYLQLHKWNGLAADCSIK